MLIVIHIPKTLSHGILSGDHLMCCCQELLVHIQTGGVYKASKQCLMQQPFNIIHHSTHRIRNMIIIYIYIYIHIIIHIINYTVYISTIFINIPQYDQPLFWLWPTFSLNTSAIQAIHPWAVRTSERRLAVLPLRRDLRVENLCLDAGLAA